MSKTNGVRVRHVRACPTSADRDAGCKCRPAYEAFVYSARERKKLRASFPTMAAAKAWRADATVGVRKGTMRTPTRTTIREAAQALIEGMRSGAVRTRSGDVYKPSVIRSYEAVLDHYVLDDLGAFRLGSVTRRDVQELVDRLLGEGRDPSTIRNALMPLRVIYRRAITRDDVTVNPTTGLELPAVRGRRDRVAAPDEAAALLAALPDSDRALWATALYAGLRLGELRALRAGSVADGVIHVSQGWDAMAGPVAPKSSAGVRSVPIPATLAAHLDAHTVRHGNALLFGRAGSRPFTDTHMRKRAQVAWEAAGLPRIGFHECRHSYRSYLNAAGVDQTRADWYMGHADHSTAGRYQHPLPGQLARDAETLDAFLTGAADGKVIPLWTGARTGAHVPQTRMATGNS